MVLSMPRNHGELNCLTSGWAAMLPSATFRLPRNRITCAAGGHRQGHLGIERVLEIAAASGRPIVVIAGTPVNPALAM